jgi:Histidine kinase-, DNA gyrase B-, and HSP90-like ATPase
MSENTDKRDDTPVNGADAEFAPQWGPDAPRGGKTVLNRILKDGFKVPLFFGQTLVRSLRDQGYNSTTSALCEHVDNAVQWGAKEIRVYFQQVGKKGSYRIDCLVWDDGLGMAPHVLKAAMSFGGSMLFENRDGIGRYGMGMKTAALSMSKVLDAYSWQEPRVVYNLTLDVDAIGSSTKNMVEMEDPSLIDELPSDVIDILTKPMGFPKRPEETQTLLADDLPGLWERMGRHGTIVYMPNCDRPGSSKAQTLAEEATREMGRVYRRQIDRGLKLYVNNRLVEAFDPTYWMTTARHAKVEGLTATQSRLVQSWQIPIPVAEGSEETALVKVKLYRLPYEEWNALSYTVLKKLHVYDDHTISFLRNGREVAIGTEAKLKLKKHHTNNWLRLEIEFPGELDEGFGVAANKQGVRLKKYVADAILKVIGQDVINTRLAISRMKSEQASKTSGSKVGKAEQRATDAEPFQGKPLPPLPPDEAAALEQNLKALAARLKCGEETEEQALERIRGRSYITDFEHNEDLPFYKVEFTCGKVILTLNTAHGFFKKIWEPLSQLARTAEDAQGEEADGPAEAGVAGTCTEVLEGMQLLLHSLARAQSQMSVMEGDTIQRVFKKLRSEWSENLETQLSAK